MTNEARWAAKVTKQQTDPDQYAEYAVEVIDTRLEKRMQDIKQTASDLLKASNYTREVLSKASTCAVLGVSWTTTTTGGDACVFNAHGQE